MRLNLLFMLILCMGFSYAMSVCIDHSDPSPPANLSVSGSVGSILLEWDAAVDEPDCSGIAYYNISRDGIWIGQTNESVLNFIDNASLSEGEYIYTVYSVDLAGGNSGLAIKNVISINHNGDSNSGGGGSSGGSICYENWECNGWSECNGNSMWRLCEDLNKCGTVKEMPALYQECGTSSDSLSVETENVSANSTGFFSGVTGAVTGFVGTPEGIAVSAFVVLMVSGFVAIRIKKRKEK